MKITPHKGGRTTFKKARLTPDEKKELDALLAKRGLGFADWVVEKLNEEQRPVEPGKPT